VAILGELCAAGRQIEACLKELAQTEYGDDSLLLALVVVTHHPSYKYEYDWIYLTGFHAKAILKGARSGRSALVDDRRAGHTCRTIMAKGRDHELICIITFM
jgi:hypothetical protein